MGCKTEKGKHNRTNGVR